MTIGAGKDRKNNDLFCMDVRRTVFGFFFSLGKKCCRTAWVCIVLSELASKEANTEDYYFRVWLEEAQQISRTCERGLVKFCHMH